MNVNGGNRVFYHLLMFNEVWKSLKRKFATHPSLLSLLHCYFGCCRTFGYGNFRLLLKLRNAVWNSRLLISGKKIISIHCLIDRFIFIYQKKLNFLSIEIESPTLNYHCRRQFTIAIRDRNNNC